MSNIETFGIIGGGEFGGVAANHLAPEDSQVLGFDKRPDVRFPEHVRRVGFEAIARADVIMLAVPFEACKTILPELAENIRPDTLLVDVCSVKMRPEEIFQQAGLLGRENVLLTHPLFGPNTTHDGVAGKDMVITHQVGPVAGTLVESWQQKHINILDMTSAEHDEEIAPVHALPFLVGRALLNSGIRPSRIRTGYSNTMMKLAEIEGHHSMELFDTVQRENPFAAAERHALIMEMIRLHNDIGVQPIRLLP